MVKSSLFGPPNALAKRQTEAHLGEAQLNHCPRGSWFTFQ
jgi:hypothetical protein